MTADEWGDGEWVVSLDFLENGCRLISNGTEHPPITDIAALVIPR